MTTYGLIGYPLGHSFSRKFFTEKFEKEGIDAQYLNFEIPSIEEFPEIIKNNPELRGLNVTIPYKQQVMQYLDEISEEAKAIGAVNVVKCQLSTDNCQLSTSSDGLQQRCDWLCGKHQAFAEASSQKGTHSRYWRRIKGYSLWIGKEVGNENTVCEQKCTRGNDHL